MLLTETKRNKNKQKGIFIEDPIETAPSSPILILRYAVYIRFV